MTFGDSLVVSGEMQNLRSKTSLASGHYLGLALHWRFTDRYRRLTALSLVHFGSAQSSVSHQRVIDGSQISHATRR
ncbi:hypothetical protein HAX54_001391, partial [Datura stramonium]|nr:hypothetical protein [Datura stramonium]